MSITELRIGNFKAFADTQRIPIKPLTLIYGPNSAGKSSIIQSLALMHEAQRLGGDLDVVRTKLGGTAIDLGGFRQYVFRTDPFRTVEWGIRLDTRNSEGPFKDNPAFNGEFGLSFQFGLEQEEVRVKELQQRPGSSEKVLFNYVQVEVTKYRAKGKPEIRLLEIEADGNPMLRISKRGLGKYVVDRINYSHPIIKLALEMLFAMNTLTEDVSDEDLRLVQNILDEELEELVVTFNGLIPSGIQGIDSRNWGKRKPGQPFAISRGERHKDLAKAAAFFIPWILNHALFDINKVIKSQLDDLHYLAPIRTNTPRHFMLSEYDDPDWHSGGAYALHWLIHSEGLRNAVNGWFGSEKIFSIPYEVVIQSRVDPESAFDVLYKGFEEIREELASAVSADHADDIESGLEDLANPLDHWDSEIYVDRFTEKLCVDEDIKSYQDILFVDKRNGTVLSNRDIGLGISQVLPVITYALGYQGQIITIEQPEYHLHPAQQAELGDVFIESALGERGNKFILESHSEHLMLRILRRIRETTEGGLPEGLTPITPDQVAVLYVNPREDGEGAEVIHIPITADGDFAQKWPKGFFTERAEELF